MHLDGDASVGDHSPGALHVVGGEIAPGDGPGVRRQRAALENRVDAHRDDAARTALHQAAQAVWRVAAGRVEQTRPLEEAGAGLVLKAVFEIAVIVLVGLGVDDNAVGELGLGDELLVVFEVGGLGAVGARGRVRETCLVLSK